MMASRRGEPAAEAEEEEGKVWRMPARWKEVAGIGMLTGVRDPTVVKDKDEEEEEEECIAFWVVGVG